jgi:hypothetical protein
VKKSFLLYKDFQAVLDKLTVTQSGHLIKAVYQYQNTGTIPDLDPATDIALASVIGNFIRDDEKYKTTCANRSEAGRKGAKQKLAKAGKRKHKVATPTDIDSEIEIDIDREIDLKEEDKPPVEEGRESNNKSSSTPAKPRRDAPPTLQEVIQFAQLAGDNNPAYITRAKEAFEFYEKNMRFLNAKVWKDGNGNTVANWKLKIRNNWFKNVTQASGQAKPRAI